jgi:predicted lipoprotein with Yx(FWY)xxD motif
MASIFTPRSLPRLRQLSTAHKLVAIGAFAAIAAAAGCSSGSATSSTSTTAASSGSGSTAATVSAVSKGTVGAVLSNAAGMTLYRYTPDTPGVSNCTGGCAATWPPLELSAGMATPVAGAGVSGLGTIKRADGSLQVTYNGMPLYTFTGDSSRTDANGQGLDGTWFVLKTTASGGAAPTATTKAPTATTAAPSGGGSGGYGY